MPSLPGHPALPNALPSLLSGNWLSGIKDTVALHVNNGNAGGPGTVIVDNMPQLENKSNDNEKIKMNGDGVPILSGEKEDKKEELVIAVDQKTSDKKEKEKTPAANGQETLKDANSDGHCADTPLLPRPDLLVQFQPYPILTRIMSSPGNSDISMTRSQSEAVQWIAAGVYETGELAQVRRLKSENRSLKVVAVVNTLAVLFVCLYAAIKKERIERLEGRIRALGGVVGGYEDEKEGGRERV